MFQTLQDYDCGLWDEHGDVNCTKLAEEAALHFDCLAWLDDDTHFVWDLAVDTASAAEERRHRSPKKRDSADISW